MKKLMALCASILIWMIGASLAMAETSLQHQIDATPEKGVLVLSGEVYTGNIRITKPLTIKGNGHTVIRGDGRGNVISIEASNVHIENVTVEHGSMDRNSAEEYSAIKVTSHHNVLRHIQISDSFHGIFLKNANDNLIENCTIKGLGKQEIAGQGNGIQLIHAKRTKLFNNVIDGNRDGIYFYYGTETISENNKITNTRYGLHYMYSDDNLFYRNQFTNNTGGAALMMSSRIELKENEFSLSEGMQGFGLLILSASNVKVIENRFFQNQKGLFCDDTNSNLVQGNHFVHNRIGINIRNTSDLVFTENHFFSNTFPVISTGAQYENKWSLDDKGNYWGDTLPVFDLNGDGVGDDPVEYRSSLDKLINDNELIYLFLSSPAINVYEKLSQVLHQQDTMFIDNRPLIEAGKRNPYILWITLFAGIGIAALYRGIRRKKV
ncbi:nitrous oxide reductase family maturation protein NosD [Brevibacillus ginsengisoli]|uniref:nitrous oxide reductase family maturation protein NosD n=1 Tax=Brevibacillus ginsengisoli TaxID=363854 RepID=UPI003CE91C9B